MNLEQPIILTFKIGPYAVLTYIVGCPQSKEAALIDPGGDEPRLMASVERLRLRPRYILNTHGHADHVLANVALKGKLAVPIGRHPADEPLAGGQVTGCGGNADAGAAADIALEDGMVLPLGSLEIRVIHTPGHTPGSVCFLVGDHLFSGDTLFVGAVGRTDLEGGSLQTLLDSIAAKLIVLPSSTRVWPGHDYGESPTSTIGRERRENPYITDFINGS
jgi:glyoxylase-like metal-dependent hydrolase (beta-lactamase superfamily II)